MKESLSERELLSCPSIFRFGAVKKLYDSGVKVRSGNLESEVGARKVFLASGRSFKDLLKYSLRFCSKTDGDVKFDNTVHCRSLIRGFSKKSRKSKKIQPLAISTVSFLERERGRIHEKVSLREKIAYYRSEQEHFLIGEHDSRGNEWERCILEDMSLGSRGKKEDVVGTKLGLRE